MKEPPPGGGTSRKKHWGLTSFKTESEATDRDWARAYLVEVFFIKLASRVRLPCNTGKRAAIFAARGREGYSRIRHSIGPTTTFEIEIEG